MRTILCRLLTPAGVSLLISSCSGSSSSGSSGGAGGASSSQGGTGGANTSTTNGSTQAFAGPNSSGSGNPLDTDVEVEITADNAYAFGWGDSSHVSTLVGRSATVVKEDIFSCPVGAGDNNGGFGPEAYVVPAASAPASAYLYVVAWADTIVTQGIIGQFRRSGSNAPPIYMQDDKWEVCATGIPYPADGSGPGPTDVEVNAQITICNNGSADPLTTSSGWVTKTGIVTPGAVGALVEGEENNNDTGDFPLVCSLDSSGKRGIDSAAKWVWYAPPGVSNPFQAGASGSNPTWAFLIFRLKAEDVPPVPP